jgi:hypothetical protein
LAGSSQLLARSNHLSQTRVRVGSHMHATELEHRNHDKVKAGLI